MKLDIMLNGEVVDALSFIIHAEKGVPARPQDGGKAEGEKFRASCLRCRCRRASAARSSRVRPLKRCASDVLAKCYGGDITRKKKLLKTEGRQEAHAPAGTAVVPQEPFMAVLKFDE